MISTRFVQVYNDAAQLCPTVSWPLTAQLMLMAIAGQESGWDKRLQVNGPARSYWQFESETVAAVIANPASGPKVAQVCGALDISTGSVFEAMAWNDTLAATMARLLLWLDPSPLPSVGSVQSAWDYYLTNWRPGAPRPTAWPGVYRNAETYLGLT